MRLPRIGPAIAVLVAVLPAAALAQKPAAKPQPDPLRVPYQALETGEYAKAEQGFRVLLAGPRRGKALIGLGRVQLETGRYQEAEESAASATAAPGLSARAHTLRGEALYARGKLDQAQQAFELAVKSKEALRARVMLGRLLLERGKKPEGEAQLLEVIEAFNEDRLPVDRAASLSYVAMAARALGSWHDANDMFREAALADRSRVETQLEWAQLFLEKYDQQHAEESVLEALVINPNSPLAHTLMARLAIARAVDLPAASEHLDEALAVNPSLVAAHVTRAAIALREMDIDSADHHLAAALTVDPNDLEALSVRAASRFLADDVPGFAQAKADVLARNPRYSRMYSIIAEYAEWEHRYEELVGMARDALALDDEDPLAYATLGMNLLRAGDEKGGLVALRSAWARDRFNVQVYNTLNFYEQVLDQEYESFQAPPFIFRAHKEERAALEPYVVPTLRAAYEDMRKRYAFTPRGPLRIELYADLQHFSVRTTGLPNVGVQGVCFGQVITALSPRGGPFNWGQITWHELAHVFHLQLSRNRVPRWFTEGLAEYETIIARPEWKREEDYDLWVALKQDRVPALREMNKAFTQARSPEALMTAYYVASKAVGFIVERFGWPKVRAMLVAWGEGQRTREVVSSTLGVDIDRIDADFRAFTKNRLKKYDDDFYVDFARYEDVDALEVAVQKAPDDADALAALSLGLVARGRFPEAEKAGLLATQRVKGHPLANFALTRVALEQGDAGRAEEHLRSIVAGGQDGYVLRILLARAALAERDTQKAMRDTEAAIAIDPEQLEGFRVLLEIAEKLGDKKLALRALRAIADLDQHDKVTHLALMVALDQERQYAELVKAGERALFLDPEEPAVHRMLGGAYLETGKPKQALVELDRGLALSKGEPSGELLLLRARALVALGRNQEGRAAAASAVAKDSGPQDARRGPQGQREPAPHDRQALKEPVRGLLPQGSSPARAHFMNPRGAFGPIRPRLLRCGTSRYREYPFGSAPCSQDRLDPNPPVRVHEMRSRLAGVSRRPRLTIPRRVFLAFALMLTVSGMVSVASYVEHQRTATTVSLVHEGYLPLSLTLSEARATQSVFGNLLDRVLSERDTSATRLWLSAARKARPATIDRAMTGVAAIEHMAPPAADRASLAALRRELRRVNAMVVQGEGRYRELYAALENGDKESAGRILADLRARERAIDGRLRAALGNVLSRIEETSARAARQQERALGILLALVALALAVGAGVTFWSHRVLSPLPRLQERVEAVARGDLAQELGPATDDEIGRLGREFERMVEAVAARDQSLTRLQRRQAQILADLRAAVLVVDGERVLRSKNPAADALFDLDDPAIGKPFEHTGLLARIEGLAEAIDAVADGQERAALAEVPLRPASGDAAPRALNLVITPFGVRPTNQRGEVLIVAEDITEELDTKARLIQSERLAAIGRMAAHVTHEVRNPLSSIGLNVEMLEEELEDAGPEAKELLRAVHREIEHLTAITEEYLRVARLPNPQLEPEDLGDLVRGTVEFLRKEFEGAGVRIELDIGRALPMVAVDETQIRQVLINLLKNAREAQPEGGRVRVQAEAGVAGVTVRVIDDGPGMNPEQRTRIFDLFYTTKAGGTGLGLPLSQQIVVAHGGLLRCESTEGQGSVFELWFPVHKVDGKRTTERMPARDEDDFPKAGE